LHFIFSNVLQAADLRAAQAAGAQLLIPPREKEGTANAQRQRPQSNSSFKLLLKREQHEEQEIAGRVLTLDRGHGPVGLEQLRKQAVRRGEETVAKSRLVKEQQARLERLSVSISLPRLSDSIRSLAVGRNVTCFALPALLTSLAEQAPSALLSCPRRLERCVRALVKLVPEFVQTLPADDFLAHETVRVNLQAPYKNVRQVVKAAADVASREKDEIMRSQQASQGVV
jgi:hypothetical protein